MSRKRLPTKAGTRRSLRTSLPGAVETKASSSDEEWHDASEVCESRKESPPKKPHLLEGDASEKSQGSQGKKIIPVDDISPFSTDDESIGEEGQELTEGPNWSQRLSQRQPGMFTRQPPVKKGTPYTRDEEISLLDYIIARKGFKHVKGKSFWEEAEMQEASGLNRTWQSLKERFMKYIMPNIDSFDFVSESDKNQLKDVLRK